MLPIRDIAKRVRLKIHDTAKATYGDDEITIVLNDGIRFIRRAIADIQPELLATTTKGLLAAGVNEIELPNRPLAIVEVTAGNEIKSQVDIDDTVYIWHHTAKIWKNPMWLWNRHTETDYYEHTLRATNLRHIKDRHAEGNPCEFYRTGLRHLHLHPIPDKETAYTVMTIDDIEEVAYTGTSPLINDFDDFLVEYATIRLSIGNEYNMSQEAQVMANIVSQIQQLLYPPPPGYETGGYWGDCACQGGGSLCY